MSRFKSLNGYEVKDEYARNVAESNLNSIGDLTELDTTDKTSVVNAINEVFNDISGDSTKIGDLNDLHTTDKTNLVNAINETDDYAHGIRQTDIGIPDGETFADHCFWDGEFGTFNVHNIMSVLNVLWWLYEIGNTELSLSSSYSLHENSETNQYEGGGTIGGTESYDNPFYWSSRNVIRKIVEFTNTFTSTTNYNVPFYKLGDDPTDKHYKLKDLYGFKGTVSYNDGTYDNIQPLESVLNNNSSYVFLDDDPTSPTYNYYVLQIQPRNLSPILNNSTKFLITFEFSTSADENANT